MDFTPQDEKALRAILDAYHADPFRVIATLYGVPLKSPVVEHHAVPKEDHLQHYTKVMGIARGIEREEPYSLPDSYGERAEQFLRGIRVSAADALATVRRVAQVLIPGYPASDAAPVSGWQRPEGTYDAYAYDENGAQVPLHDPRAVAYTLLGAIYKSEATIMLPLFVAPFDYSSIPLWEGSTSTEPEHIRDYLFDIMNTLFKLAVREKEREAVPPAEPAE